MDHENKQTKIPFKKSLAYGIGGLGEGIGYNFFFGYFLFFLTSIAGIPSAIAGTISMIAVVWDAVSDPLIGFLSDHSKNPKGRRRPFILKGSVLLGVSLILLFTNLNISLGAKVAYYIVANILYWLGLTCSVIPHTSLGAELTDDYNERTTLRAYQTFFMNIGAGVALSGTLMIVAFFKDRFSSDTYAWIAAGAFFGIVAFISYFISYLATKGSEPTGEAVKEAFAGKEKTHFFKEYASILKNKPLRFVLSADFAVNFVLGISVSLRVFLYSFTFNFSEGLSSTLLLVYSGVIIVGVWLVDNLSKKIGKKNTMVVGLFTYAAGFFVAFFLPPTPVLIGFGLFLEAIGNCTFWTLLYSFAYDASVVEQFKHGKGNEGIMVSMIGLIMKAANAIGMWIAGVGLSIIGFKEDALTQAAGTQQGIKIMYCIFSGIILLLGGLVFMKYPLTEDKYEKLKGINEAGHHEASDLEGLEKLI